MRYTRSIWEYTDTAESLICAFKYGHSRSLGDILADTAVEAIQSGIYPPDARYNWNLVLPLPSMLSSLKQRGFSPVGEIVKRTSRKLKLPFALLALETCGNHPAQASLSPIERLRHIKKKYRASAKQVAGKKILLIDDVITSGASAIGATISLLEAGATTVDLLSLCRSNLFAQLRGELWRKTK